MGEHACTRFEVSKDGRAGKHMCVHRHDSLHACTCSHSCGGGQGSKEGGGKWACGRVCAHVVVKGWWGKWQGGRQQGRQGQAGERARPRVVVGEDSRGDGKVGKGGQGGGHMLMWQWVRVAGEQVGEHTRVVGNMVR